MCDAQQERQHRQHQRDNKSRTTENHQINNKSHRYEELVKHNRKCEYSCVPCSPNGAGAPRPEFLPFQERRQRSIHLQWLRKQEPVTTDPTLSWRRPSRFRLGIEARTTHTHTYPNALAPACPQDSWCSPRPEQARRRRVVADKNRRDTVLVKILVARKVHTDRVAKVCNCELRLALEKRRAEGRLVLTVNEGGRRSKERRDERRTGQKPTFCPHTSLKQTLRNSVCRYSRVTVLVLCTACW